MKKQCDENQENPYIVPAFARGLKLIECLSENPEGLGMSEMGSLELPQATLFRMLTTLVESGYAVREKNNIYRLNGKLLSVAYKAVENTSLTTVADGPMRELRDLTGESVMLAVLHGSEGVVLHQAVSNNPVKVVLEIGHHFPLHSAAPAKAILAFLPEERRNELIRGIKFTPFTQTTIRNEKEYRKELEDVRKNGVAFDWSEELEDIRCIAAPVFWLREKAVAAISIGGLTSRITKEKMNKFAEPIRKTAEIITKKLN